MNRRIFFQAHKWAALSTGLFLGVIGITGSVLAFDDEIAGWLYRGSVRIDPSPVQVPLTEQARIVRRTFPRESLFGVRLGASDRATAFFAGNRQIMVNGHTGEVTGTRPSGDFVRMVRKLHEGLGFPGGQVLVAFAALALLLLSATGVALWWREKRVRVRWSTPRAAYDSHHSVGIVANLYLLVLAITALFMALPLAPLIFKLAGSKQPERRPLASTVVKGAAAVPLDRVLEIAQAALPELAPEVVLFPRGVEGLYRVGMRQGADSSLAGDIQIDQYSGKVLAADRVNNSDPAMRIVLGIRAFHTGRWWGIPAQLLASLSGLVLVAQAFTGFLMWRG